MVIGFSAVAETIVNKTDNDKIEIGDDNLKVLFAILHIIPKFYQIVILP